MLLLDEVKKRTEKVFENNKIVLPEPPILWKDKIEALEEAKLTAHRASCIFDMRKWQAEELGFKEINSTDMVEMLMKEKHTDEAEGSERHTYEWAYNHHDDVLLNNTWGGKPTIFKRIVRAGFWHLPPFNKKTVWEVQFSKLNYLKRDIPYGVVLKINECKELKLFNCFNVMAPMEAWERKTDIDPIVVATIWELPPNDEGKFTTAGQTAHYFLAQW